MPEPDGGMTDKEFDEFLANLYKKLTGKDYPIEKQISIEKG